VLAADTEAEALRQREVRRRTMARTIFGRPGQPLDDERVEALLQMPQARHVDDMLTHTALGTGEQVGDYLERFRRHADADELITVHHADTLDGRLRSLELTAAAASRIAA